MTTTTAYTTQDWSLAKALERQFRKQSQDWMEYAAQLPRDTVTACRASHLFSVAQQVGLSVASLQRQYA